MKVAFFFDTVLVREEDNFYGMTLTYDFLRDRYLSLFDTLVLSTRVKEKKEYKGNISGYRITNGENVEVSPIFSYNEVIDAIKNKKKISEEVDTIVKKVDKVIVRMPSVIGMFACDSANKFNKPYLIEMVACPFDGYMNHARFGGKLLAPIMFILNKKYVRKAPKVLYVTDCFLQHRYPTKGDSLACSDVVLDTFDDTILENRKKKILEMKNLNKIKIATIASVQLKYKGQEYVFKAIQKLKKKGIIIDYYLAGGGDNSRLLNFVKKYNIENQVHFLGSLPHEKVFELVDNVDLYIQPSLQEGLPRALIEAMSRACPAIGSNAGGIPELLDKNYIFRKRDVNMLIKIFDNLSKESLLKQSEKNYSRALEFEKEKLNAKRTLFYKSI